MNKLSANCVNGLRSGGAVPVFASLTSTMSHKAMNPASNSSLLDQLNRITSTVRQSFLLTLGSNAWTKSVESSSSPSSATKSNVEQQGQSRFQSTTSHTEPTTHSSKPAASSVQPNEIEKEEKLTAQDHSSSSSSSSTSQFPLPAHPVISRSLLRTKCKNMVESLQQAKTVESQNLRLQELCSMALVYPDCPPMIAQQGGIRTLLSMQQNCQHQSTQALIRQSLAVIGYACPPSGKGVKLLSIDGGGTKGLVILEVLRHLEQTTGKPIHQLFDLICGVSTGAILATLLGTLHLSIDECERIYKETSIHMFQANIFSGTSRLLLKHAYYDTERWESILKKMFTDRVLIETSQSEYCPKVVLISALSNTPRLQPFAFRNYNLPDKSLSYYESSCQHRVWEAIRASAAAPGYFEEFILDGLVHQDGGVLINNPAAIAIHEAQLLWPNEPIQTCVSIGSGKFTPTAIFSRADRPSQTSLMTKIAKLIDSATDTEGVHRLLQDILPTGTYFRLNPTLTSYFSIDETDPQKLNQMKLDALMYLRKNEYKMQMASQSLLLDRGYVKRSQDWFKQQAEMFF